MNNELEREYIEKGGSFCPNCKSDNIVADGLEADGRVAWSNVTCRKCGATWTDQFHLTHLDNLVVPNKQIVVTVEGGVIQAITGIPEGVEVKVIDFDAEGSENYELVEGEPAIVSIYQGESK